MPDKSILSGLAAEVFLSGLAANTMLNVLASKVTLSGLAAKTIAVLDKACPTSLF